MSAFCGRCGRALKSPRSAKVGMGATCKKKAEFEKAMAEVEEQKRLELQQRKAG